MTEEVNVESQQADEKYYEAFLDMFSSDGWKQLMNECKQNGLTLNNVSEVKDAEQLWYTKGQLNILGNMLNLETTVRFAIDQLNEEEEAENLDETD